MRKCWSLKGSGRDIDHAPVAQRDGTFSECCIASVTTRRSGGVSNKLENNAASTTFLVVPANSQLPLERSLHEATVWMRRPLVTTRISQQINGVSLLDDRSPARRREVG